ncbi:MAG: CDP-glycerol glycerophosphotransferase family protein, partial [Methanosphaera sp.]|nr:CDP-glycerol glycerophosphotransferase family protein [Methanosphaera sp.]
FLDKKKYGVVDNAEYFYRQRLTGTSTVDVMKENKRYFTDRLKNFYLKLANYCIKKEKCVPKFIQYLFAYDLQWLLKVDSLEVLDNTSQLNEFWKVLKQVLDYIDMDCIIDNKYIDEHILPFFIYLKNNHSIITTKSDQSLAIKSGDYIVEEFSKIVLWLDIIEYRRGYLNFSGNIESCFNDKYIHVKLVKESGAKIEEYDTKHVMYNNPKRQTLKYLGINWKYNYNFDTQISVSLNDMLYFKIEYDDGQIQYASIPLISFRESCGLSTSSAYFLKDSIIILFKEGKFNILPYSFKSMLRYEASNIKRVNYDKEPHYGYAIFIHIIYCIMYLFMKNKRIWLYSDRPDFADDNAKALFEYTCNMDDGVSRYFIVDKNSSSYNNLKRINKNIVAFGSFKHEILYLFAQKVISSYVNENFINPFHYFTPSLYSGLITSYRYFLQHGVTKDDVSEFIKKYDKNLSLIVCVSNMERDSFLADGYNFDSHVIQTLGFCRFDKLTSDDAKRQILFAPTWRLELSNEEKFIESQYYKTLKSFLNSEKLKSLVEVTCFTMVFKPHPELNDYIDLLDVPEYIHISEDESYQELFRDSSLLITDYSSVYFDFAYLKKPVIYYQKDDDYHYKEGYFKYDTHGFGKVIKKEEELIDEIHHIIKNECIMEDKYKKRVDEFFKYNDKNNC